MVEDDPNTRELYKDAFAEKGFEALILPNADGDFLGKVVKFDPDIISMDLMIANVNVPDARDGFEAMELLKSDPRTENIPFIILSNFIEEGKIRRTRSLGAVDYIIASAYSPTKIATQFLLYISDPDNYKPIHPLFKEV